MSDDGPRAGLLTTRADKKERRNEKVRRHKRQSAPWCWCSCAKKPSSSSVERRGTREVDNENIFWLKLLFCDEAEDEKK